MKCMSPPCHSNFIILKKAQLHVYLSLPLPISSSFHESVIIVSISLPVPDPEWVFPLHTTQSVLLCYLQDFSSDVLLAALTLDAKHGVVVHLTEGDSIPDGTTQDKSADRRQHGAADTLRITPETTQSPTILHMSELTALSRWLKKVQGGAPAADIQLRWSNCSLIICKHFTSNTKNCCSEPKCNISASTALQYKSISKDVITMFLANNMWKMLRDSVKILTRSVLILACLSYLYFSSVALNYKNMEPWQRPIFSESLIF